MSWDNDDNGFDFNFDDLSPEERKEINRKMNERKIRIENHPLVIKAEVVFNIVSAFITTIPADEREVYSGILMESAMMLKPKIAGAMGSDSWLLSMQNASLIRYHAEYLLTSTSGFNHFFEADRDYVKLFRNELIEFKNLFKEWIKEINQLEQEEYIDEWGLFIRKQNN